ncbi:hypothetical protein ABZP36_007236, partial [Zizania latifolia]
CLPSPAAASPPSCHSRWPPRRRLSMVPTTAAVVVTCRPRPPCRRRSSSCGRTTRIARRWACRRCRGTGRCYWTRFGTPASSAGIAGRGRSRSGALTASTGGTSTRATGTAAVRTRRRSGRRAGSGTTTMPTCARRRRGGPAAHTCRWCGAPRRRSDAPAAPAAKASTPSPSASTTRRATTLANGPTNYSVTSGHPTA